MTTTNERDLYYARRLAEMIRCKTVSRKEGFEPEEFLKLRRVIGTLFPLVTEKAERTILGEDAYLYKLPGKDPGRNVLLMSHHDVVEATGSWQEAPFAGVIRGGKLWGRGTVDTKTPLFAEFSALEELLLEGFEFPVNVYLFSSHNEEYSGDGALLAHDYFIGHRRARKGPLHRPAYRRASAGPRGTCRCAQDAGHAHGRLHDGGRREKALHPPAAPRGARYV